MIPDKVKMRASFLSRVFLWNERSTLHRNKKHLNNPEEREEAAEKEEW